MPKYRAGAAPASAAAAALPPPPPRGVRPPLDGPSVASSTSAPPSTTTPEASDYTGTSTVNGKQALHQRREDQLRHALAHTAPTSVEVSAVASAAYVQALMGLIDRHGESVLEMTAAIDALRERREHRYAEAEQVTQQQAAELHHLRGERADLALQVQEERERSTRLLHENTVLHAQRAEQREQLGKLVELCRARGKRLRVLGSAASGARVAAAVGAASAAAEDRSDLDHDTELARLGHGQRSSSNGIAGEPGTSARPGAPPAAAVAATTAASAMPSSPPASLSIHRAAGLAASRGGVSSAFPTPAAGAASSSLSLDGIADDAEVAALLNVPYKLHVAASPSGAAGSSSSTSSAAPHIITANTAATAHLLALTAEVNMLRQQLDQQRITYEHERGLRSREADEVHRQHLDQEAKYRAALEQLELLHEESLRDLVQYRHATEKQLRDVRGQVDWLRAALQEALDLAEKDRRRQHNEVYATEQRISRQYYPKVQSLHAEVEECRRSSLAQAHDHAKLLAEKEALVEELQQRLRAEASQRKRIEERYRLEMEGVHSELDLMRQSLRQMERRVYYRDARDQASEEAQLELERYYT